METCADGYVHYLAEQLAPQEMAIEEIQQPSTEDELTQIWDHLITNQLHKLPQPYKAIAEELCVTAAWYFQLNSDNEPSAGPWRSCRMMKCKQCIRSKLWWPQMDNQIEEHIRSCHLCQVTSRPEWPEPVCPTKLSKEPWTHLALDVCGPFPTGESVVILTDYYSRWLEVKILKSVTSANILAWLDTVFASYDYPIQIKANNTSYFTSHEFRSTLKTWGVEMKTVTKHWPQANGQAEHFNQILLKLILTAIAANNYRSTTTRPHRRHQPNSSYTTSCEPSCQA